MLVLLVFIYFLLTSKIVLGMFCTSMLILLLIYSPWMRQLFAYLLVFAYVALRDRG